MIVINFFGGPGCGKSTLAAGLFYRMKLLNMNVELVTEYAKDLVYSNQLESMMEHQEVLYAEQNYRIQRLLNKVDWVITDSPILLSAVYPKINKTVFELAEWPAYDQFRDLVRTQFEFYNNINIWLERDDNNYRQEGRLHTVDQAKTADDLIWDEISRYNNVQFSLGPNVLENILSYILMINNRHETD